ncbi:MAG: type III pantothenate kinase, partial [Saprospiraceae bacterium]|nr:type III pantothenate kinase [Saprospiraceae bacterium]
MNLTIDLGNTLCKIIIFDDNVIVYRHICKSLSTRSLHQLFQNFQIRHSLISSVIPLKPLLKKTLKKYGIREFSSTTKIPIKNLYTTPKTLGKDRLANGIAGAFLFPKQNVLVIDAGTCIKYDFVDSRKHYKGGNISPGLSMRFIAMHKLTGKLPLVEINDPRKLIGTSTVTAIQSGVFNGMIEEIKGIIALYKNEYPKVKVILTGGDAHRFAGQLNLSIFAASDLVN